jgi:hypothetical protein
MVAGSQKYIVENSEGLIAEGPQKLSAHLTLLTMKLQRLLLIKKNPPRPRRHTVAGSGTGLV